MEVGDIYRKVHGLENREEDIMANMVGIKEGSKKLRSERDNIEEASKIPYLKALCYQAYVQPFSS
jgi:hypothetical protein